MNYHLKKYLDGGNDTCALRWENDDINYGIDLKLNFNATAGIIA